MRVSRYPNGFIELENGVVTIGGGETVTIAVQDVRSAIAREGKKSIFSRNPPAVFEIEYAEGLGVTKVKMLVPTEELPRARELAAAIHR